MEAVHVLRLQMTPQHIHTEHSSESRPDSPLAVCLTDTGSKVRMRVDRKPSSMSGIIKERQKTQTS